MSDHHHHGHDHDPHAPIEEAGGPPNRHELLEMALRELLIDRGMISAAEVTAAIQDMEQRRPDAGARLVAHIWNDPAFRQRALADGKAACRELGIEVDVAPDLMIVENTPQVHHAIVCTLCSCYPKAVLGVPPAWYKSPAYRARMAHDPRGVLREFGTELPAGQELRVVDSTAEVRYLVVPVRPEGTEGWSEAELERLVTRDSMIGVSPALTPADLA